MIEWRSLSSDPTNRAATMRMDEFLRSITRVERVTRMDMILDFCRGQDVLDIGAGEHDVAFYSEEGWEHGRIVRVAKKAVAVEINPELCAHYKAKGFDFRCVDATSDADLGERFDRVFIGDVIEHVNDPVALLAFTKRHLKPDGRILLTTPNPFAPRFRRHRSERHTRYVMANLEHTRWVSISNMHELAWRAGLQLSALRWPLLKKPKTGLARTLALFGKECLLAIAPIEDVFVEYAFELAQPRESRSPKASDVAKSAA
ncbi:class I SAM-dependent methyltransferase [Terricaulis silvestris]|uniref:Cobalt-precorrin-6Y C(15)-methyltransferase n=1 Tax=Terricaulis silvestris TaxID=2686094 RepID=A0A6I6MKV8_9CAUL|nr:class I SAM-dependent methyltransferase [Terricaulis silvestris]QGZ94651.1 cobalt-precorrin-6Y C(15)-methyltransferase [Terricaulis silvestris]